MAQEGPQHDDKRDFDISTPRALLDLVKDIIAIANSGGGSITFGRTETEVPGISDEACRALDSAKVADQVDKHVAPSNVQLSHEINEIDPGKRILTISIEAAEYPLVVSKPATWKPSGKKAEVVILHKGDIWVRHSSKNEHATRDDLRRWLESARSSERATIFERMAMLVNLPEGSSLEVVARSGAHIDTPSQLIESARLRRRWDRDHLLSADDLLWIFSQRAALTPSDDDLKVLVASALRKSATLYYWVAVAEHNPNLIVEELIAVLSASDRDKSDAGGNVAELAAFYADDTTLRGIVKTLRNSEYKHFKEAAASWQGRSNAKRLQSRRISSASYKGTLLSQLGQDKLEELADQLTSTLLGTRSSSAARMLSDVNRLIWARKTGRVTVTKGRKGKK